LRLKGKRLIIIPDGILHYLPFETLITNPPETGTPHYLIQLDYQISYAPSASVFGEIQQENKQRKGKPGKDTRKEIFAVGDAIFDVTEFQAERKKQKEAQQPQLAIAQSEPQTGSASRTNKFGLSRGDYEQSGYSLQRLPNTAVELAEIQKVYGSQAEIHLRLEATEELVKSGKLNNFKIIHFAVHGILNERVPSLSAVVLNQDDDENEDGFLTMGEVFNIELNADLVVLSACQTGLGKRVAGEGLVGLTRAFLYAGTPSTDWANVWRGKD
jgi:CHAT domain-containing protein